MFRTNGVQSKYNWNCSYIVFLEKTCVEGVNLFNKGEILCPIPSINHAVSVKLILSYNLTLAYLMGYVNVHLWATWAVWVKCQN